MGFLGPIEILDLGECYHGFIGNFIKFCLCIIRTAPSGPPLNISALPVNSKSVVVRWDPPNPSLQHGSILGYHVFASLQPSTNQAGTNNSLVVDEKWSQQTELGALKPNSQYRISIRAYNSVGMGPESPFVHVHTPEGGEQGWLLAWPRKVLLIGK